MRIITLVVTMLGLVTGLQAQTTAPIEVVNSAIAAVNDLGKQVVLGKMKTSMERMYPQWRQRLSERAGGDAALEKTFDEMMAEMMKQGTTMISFKTFGFPTVYDVYPGKKSRSSMVNLWKRSLTPSGCCSSPPKSAIV